MDNENVNPEIIDQQLVHGPSPEPNTTDNPLQKDTFYSTVTDGSEISATEGAQEIVRKVYTREEKKAIRPEFYR